MFLSGGGTDPNLVHVASQTQPPRAPSAVVAAQIKPSEGKVRREERETPASKPAKPLQAPAGGLGLLCSMKLKEFSPPRSHPPGAKAETEKHV